MAYPLYSDDYLKDYAKQSAVKYGVPTDMFMWQIGRESGWNQNAKNPNSSATGIAQFIKGTAKEFGINPLDPIASLDAAAKYDAQLYAKTGSWQSALTSYGTLHGASSKTLDEFNASLDSGGSYDAMGNYTGGTGDSQSGSAKEAVTQVGSYLATVMSRPIVVVLGVIFIAGAIYLFGTGQTQKLLTTVAKNAIT